MVHETVSYETIPETSTHFSLDGQLLAPDDQECSMDQHCEPPPEGCGKMARVVGGDDEVDEVQGECVVEHVRGSTDEVDEEEDVERDCE